MSSPKPDDTNNPHILSHFSSPDPAAEIMALAQKVDGKKNKMIVEKVKSMIEAFENQIKPMTKTNTRKRLCFLDLFLYPGLEYPSKFLVPKLNNLELVARESTFTYTSCNASMHQK